MGEPSDGFIPWGCGQREEVCVLSQSYRRLVVGTIFLCMSKQVVTILDWLD